MADGMKSAIDDGTAAAEEVGDAIRNGAAKAREAFSERIADPAARAAEAMKASGEQVAKGGSAIGITMIEQAEKNAREAFAAMRAAAEAKDLSDVLKIQGDYLRQQGERSMAQARQISELIMQFGKDAVAPLTRDRP
ncbi:phasin family protein [Sphingomonas sp. PB2P19]|uniref:phasin family protein n=1 Tax=Sphingomonas rhamnosi TaxID=3096156 RepID=UPI002FC958AA